MIVPGTNPKGPIINVKPSSFITVERLSIEKYYSMHCAVQKRIKYRIKPIVMLNTEMVE